MPTITTTTNEWFLYSANLSVQKTQRISTHHSQKYTHIHTCNPYMKNMVCPDLWNGLLKKGSSELSFEVRQHGYPPQTTMQNFHITK